MATFRAALRQQGLRSGLRPTLKSLCKKNAPVCQSQTDQEGRCCRGEQHPLSSQQPEQPVTRWGEPGTAQLTSRKQAQRPLWQPRNTLAPLKRPSRRVLEHLLNYLWALIALFVNPPSRRLGALAPQGSCSRCILGDFANVCPLQLHDLPGTAADGDTEAKVVSTKALTCSSHRPESRRSGSARR